MTKPRARPLIEPRLLSKREAADYCGVSVNTFTKEFQVRHIKVGRVKMYDRRVLDLDLDRRSGLRAPSRDEVMEAARAI